MSDLATNDGAPLGHTLGLRVDVTSRVGAEVGLPRLEEVFAATGARASIFVSVGPDRTGWRILPYLRNPLRLPAGFRLAMQAGLSASGTVSDLLRPADTPIQAGIETVRRMAAGGHEVGCMGFDYWKWVAEMPRGSAAAPFAVLDQEAALESFREAFGSSPTASAAPGFLCSEETLRAEESHGLSYASDCRGTDPFFPVISGKTLTTPQVPVTLPTISELLAEKGADAATAFETLLGRVSEEKWPVLRIRAEWEGGPHREAFRKFLEELRASGRSAIPLGNLLERRLAEGPLPRCTLTYGELEGRPGIVSLQMFEV